MKVVHINRKDIEREKAMLEEGNAILRAVSKRLCERWLKRREAREVVENKSRPLPTGKIFRPFNLLKLNYTQCLTR